TPSANPSLSICLLDLHDALPICSHAPAWERTCGTLRVPSATPGMAALTSRAAERPHVGSHAGAWEPATKAHGPRPVGLQKSFLRSEEHTYELKSQDHLVCRLLLE